uniref:carboxylesterase/lipase family protein n=1 Tax=Sphingomonas bacterium TaxID=1895847 RepID=UPI0026274B01|nr:carboxylesterase family protein [Sphingomonas bacterium]
MTSPDQMIDAAAVDAALAATAAGRVRGSVTNGIRTFLGVPYAAPPVGDNRFALPRPVAAWEGERDATAPGPCAPQRLKPFPQLDVAPLIGDGGTRGDDYLTLNIWAPVAASNAPVMVFIHGGGFVIGNKDAPVSDGSGFARSGVVCVAINYRMGVDGFLPIPGVPANLGLRDMLAALAWVQANIASFGGDPGNVTVFGESAGAMAIADLVASPLATGLFQRAIIESGHGAMVRDIGIAQRLVRKLAKILKITPDAAGFAKPDAEALFDAIEKVSSPLARLDLRDTAGHEPVFGISRFIPVFGDDVLPEPPIAALGKGAGAAVDVLIGTNAEEMRLYFVPTGVKRKMFGWLARWVVGKSNPHARAVLKAYGMGRKGVTAGDAFTAALSDLVFRWPARQYAAAHQGRTHMYEFDWRSPACDGELGACHGIELPFVFDTLATATGQRGLAGEAPPQELVTRVHKFWVDFATDGRLPWDAFTAETRLVYSLEKGAAFSEPVMPAAAFLP